MTRWLALILALLLVAGCGPSERPKFNIKRAKDYEPIVPPESPRATATADTTATAAPAIVVEIDAFKGTCDHSFSGINGQDVVSLANASGLRSYRLAGIAIPDEIRAEAHGQLRSWLEGDAIGVEIDGASPGAEPAAYVYRCSSKSMLNADLVSAGLAVVSDAPATHRDALNKASMQALTARRGVWGKPRK
ncbi:MAG: thermonuclease family protein [Thermoanaerobaculia bacterium]|jgi:endonuclease YncB( thermonuclease family)